MHHLVVLTLACHHCVYVNVDVLFIPKCFANSCTLCIILRYNVDGLLVAWIDMLIFYQIFKYFQLKQLRNKNEREVMRIFTCNKCSQNYKHIHIDIDKEINTHTTCSTSCLLLHNCSFSSSVVAFTESSSPTTWQNTIGICLFGQISNWFFVSQALVFLVINLLS